MQGSSMVMSEVIASLHEYTRPSGLDGLHVTSRKKIRVHPR